MATAAAWSLVGYVLARRWLSDSAEPIDASKEARFDPNETSRLVFLGSGCSSGTPIAGCVQGIAFGRPIGGCRVCRAALTNRSDPNHRFNPSLLIQSPPRRPGEDRTRFNLVVDVGKTFHESALATFPTFHVAGVDAVILTHHHADAVLGLDDLRVVQRAATTEDFREVNPQRESSRTMAVRVAHTMRGVIDSFLTPEEVQSRPGRSLDLLEPVEPYKKATHLSRIHLNDCVVYASDVCFRHLQRVFPYLMTDPTSKTTPGGPARFVSRLRFEEPFPCEDVEVSFPVENFFRPSLGLRVDSLPVLHGSDFVSNGYAFGDGPDRVVYLSDVSSVPEATLKKMQSYMPIRYFIVDVIRPKHDAGSSVSTVHFDLQDALRLVQRLGPPRETFLVGMAHEMEHVETNEELARLPADRFGKVRLAHDGLCLDGLRLSSAAESLPR